MSHCCVLQKQRWGRMIKVAKRCNFFDKKKNTCFPFLNEVEMPLDKRH